MTLDYTREPACVQRVINSQINEIVGGGHRQPIPDLHDFRSTSGPGAAATSTTTTSATTTTSTTRRPSA